MLGRLVGWELCLWWGGGVNTDCGSCVHGGVGGVFVVVGCAGEEWGGWVFMCRVDLYNPYVVPHTIPKGNFNYPRSTNRIKFFS